MPDSDEWGVWGQDRTDQAHVGNMARPDDAPCAHYIKQNIPSFMLFIVSK